MQRIARFLVIYCAGCFVAVRVCAQDTLFDQPKQILLYTDKPALVGEIDYRALVTQAEIRLRLAGFTVQSGSSAQFAKDTRDWTDKMTRASKEDSKSLADEYKRTHPPSIRASLGISLLKNPGSGESFVYAVEVNVIGDALIPTPNSPLEIVEMKGRDGKSMSVIPGGKRVHYAAVWLFKSPGKLGVGRWTDAAATAELRPR